MSTLDLAALKASLRVTHNHDDALLQQLLDSAESEACQFLNRESLPEGDDLEVKPDVRTALWLLVSARYEAPSTRDSFGYRRAAETLLWPYRCGLGI